MEMNLTKLMIERALFPFGAPFSLYDIFTRLLRRGRAMIEFDVVGGTIVFFERVSRVVVVVMVDAHRFATENKTQS